MELDERKVKILKAIIKNYMDTGEPVGSRTISKYLDTKWSTDEGRTGDNHKRTSRNQQMQEEHL